MARPSKYTAERVERLLHGIRLGWRYELACAYAGVHYATFARWRLAFPQFCEAVKEAEAQGEATSLRAIHAAASAGEWRAAAWLLERRFPETYGRRVNRNGMISIEKAQYVVKAVMETICTVIDDDTVDAVIEALDQKTVEQLVALAEGDRGGENDGLAAPR